jgi:hypothetical protein
MPKIKRKNGNLFKIIYITMVFILLACIILPQAVIAAEDPDLIVEIRDSADVEMKIRCYPDQELIKDPKVAMLWEYLNMTITQDDVVIYKGKANRIPDPLVEHKKLARKATSRIDVVINFSKNADNYVQGTPLRMLWDFEASGENGANVQLSSDHFYYNGNINPGDVLKYSMVINNSGDRDIVPPSTSSTPPAPSSNPPIAPPTGVDTGVTGTESTNNIPTFVIFAVIIVAIISLTLIIVQFVQKRREKNQ